VCVCVSVCIWMHIWLACVYPCTHASHACVCVCVDVCVWMCVCVCAHTCTNTHTHSHTPIQTHYSGARARALSLSHTHPPRLARSLFHTHIHRPTNTHTTFARTSTLSLSPAQARALSHSHLIAEGAGGLGKNYCLVAGKKDKHCCYVADALSCIMTHSSVKCICQSKEETNFIVVNNNVISLHPPDQQ